MENKFSLKEVVVNIIYSFFSFAMPTAVLQFFVQPIIAKYLGAEMNGQYLTVMSMNYFIIGITAAVLNNVRLLQQEKYEQDKSTGDFNIFLLYYAIIVTVCVPIGWYLYTDNFDTRDIILMLSITYMYLFHDYIFAEYRLKLQYNQILVNNVLMTIGYFLGLFLFVCTGKWQIVFIAAYSLPTVFDLFNTTFWREPLRKTPLFKNTTHKVLQMTFSNALGSAPSYCDKFVLYPLLGGASVSVYNSATIVGKLLILVSAPLNSVLLSYIVKIHELKFKLTAKRISIIVLVILFAYFGCVLIGFPLTSFLYPEWASESQKYIFITVGSSLFTLIGNLLNTVIIRFYNLNYQIIIQMCTLFLYFTLSIAALHLWGLLGFGIAVALVAFLKVICYIILIFYKK